MRKFVYWNWYLNGFSCGMAAASEAEAWRILRAAFPAGTGFSGAVIDIDSADFQTRKLAGMNPETGAYPAEDAEFGRAAAGLRRAMRNPKIAGLY